MLIEIGPGLKAVSSSSRVKGSVEHNEPINVAYKIPDRSMNISIAEMGAGFHTYQAAIIPA